MKIQEALNIVRNPWGYCAPTREEARLMVADRYEEAVRYINLLAEIVTGEYPECDSRYDDALEAQKFVQGETHD